MVNQVCKYSSYQNVMRSYYKYCRVVSLHRVLEYTCSVGVLCNCSANRILSLYIPHMPLINCTNVCTNTDLKKIIIT